METPRPISEYNFQCWNAIEICLAIEQQGIAFYEQAATQVDHDRIRELFLRLAGEEKEHSRNLQAKAQFLQPAVQRHATRTSDVRAFIAEYINGKIFPLKGGRKAEIPKLESDSQALEMSIESERRSMEILQRLLEAEKKLDVRAIISHLLTEEKKHLAALQALQGDLSRAKNQRSGEEGPA